MFDFSTEYRLSFFMPAFCLGVGQDIAVGIATRYGLDGPGVESRWGGARFSAPVHTGPGAHTASFTIGTGSVPPRIQKD